MAQTISKRTKANYESYDREKAHSTNDGLGVLRTLRQAKFDETVDLAIRLGIDPTQADQQIRGSYSLPHGTGKAKRVIAITRGEKADEARAAGADEVGAEELVQKIEGGWLEFDVCVTTPDMMPLVGKLGRVLGPHGKMPSPKSGTVTDHIGNTVTEYKAGRIEYRNDKAGNIHVPVGRLSFSDDQLKENIASWIEHVKGLKPASSKGTFIRSVTISSTMGPGIRLSVTD